MKVNIYHFCEHITQIVSNRSAQKDPREKKEDILETERLEWEELKTLCAKTAESENPFHKDCQVTHIERGWGGFIARLEFPEGHMLHGQPSQSRLLCSDLMNMADEMGFLSYETETVGQWLTGLFKGHRKI